MHTGRVWLKTIAHVGLPRRFSVEDSVLPLQGTQVWSLVRELRFHMPCSAVKTKFKKKNQVRGPCWNPLGNGIWPLLSPSLLDSAWYRFFLYLSSNPHTTLSPATPWSSAQEGMVRPRRMVESLEDRGQESFFCGPPGKLQPGQFLALMVVLPLPTY